MRISGSGNGQRAIYFNHYFCVVNFNHIGCPILVTRCATNLRLVNIWTISMWCNPCSLIPTTEFDPLVCPILVVMWQNETDIPIEVKSNWSPVPRCIGIYQDAPYFIAHEVAQGQSLISEASQKMELYNFKYDLHVTRKLWAHVKILPA